MKRMILLAVVGVSCMTTGVVSQTKNDDDSPSPFMSTGDASKLLDHLNRPASEEGNADPLRHPSAQHAALTVLESLPDTTKYIGSSLMKNINAEVDRELEMDLMSTVWMDLNCAPGEGAVIKLCTARAARFKQASLPNLWRISKLKKDGGFMIRDPDRLGRWATDVMKRIVRQTKDVSALVEALNRADEKELVKAIEKWREGH